MANSVLGVFPHAAQRHLACKNNNYTVLLLFVRLDQRHLAARFESNQAT